MPRENIIDLSLNDNDLEVNVFLDEGLSPLQYALRAASSESKAKEYAENASGSADVSASYNNIAKGYAESAKAAYDRVNGLAEEVVSDIEAREESFNANAEAKTIDFNENAVARTEEFDAHSAEMRNEINQLSESINDISEYIKTWVIKENDLQQGFINDDGVVQSHPSRWCTDFIKVNKGDVLFTNRFNDSLNNNWASRINIYNTSKLHTEINNWAAVNVREGGLTFTNDGFIRISVQGISKDKYDGRISIIHYSMTTEESLFMYKGIDFETIKSNFLKNGYYDGTTFKGSNARVCNAIPIRVNKGDELHPTNKNVIFDASFGNDGNWKSVSNLNPVKASSNGYGYFNLRNQAGTEIDPKDFGGLLKIKKAEHISDSVEYFTKDMLVNGYFDADYNIQNANHRIVSFDRIHANKGDRVRFVNQTVGMHIQEFDSSGRRIDGTTSPRVPFGKNTGVADIGDYIVKNDDVWVAIQIYNFSSPSSSMNLDDYNIPACVVHVDSIDNKFPTSCKKPNIINKDGFKEMQDGTIVGDKLWISCDDYATNKVFKVFNLETKTVEKTISHDFGHVGSIDYNANNDSLVICSEKLFIYKNVSDVVGATMSKIDANCVEIIVPSDVYASAVCWGEDEQVLYVLCGYDGTKDINKVWKFILEKIGGNYTGNGSVSVTFDMNIVEGGNMVSNKNNYNYTQGCEYDGYLYVGYGNTAHNFLILDLDETTGKANVVGNYFYKRYDDSRKLIPLEPQIVALNGNKIILGARDWTSSTSILSEFDRIK